MAEALKLVDVLIGKVDAAGERDFPVNDDELAVIAVVLMG